MARILHAADLHLSVSEKEYGLTVLDEIVATAVSARTDALVFAGDLFDSFADCESLRADFRAHVQPLGKRCLLLFLPGNHEDLGRGSRPLSGLDFGAAQILEEKPFRVHRLADVEILAIPHQRGYAEYREWKVPPKTTKIRIAFAHALVAGAGFTLDDVEEEASVMDPDLFARCGVDYAALGHIHAERTLSIGALTLSYPGSSRVWRRGEAGPRVVHLIEADADVRSSPIVLLKAGMYRRYDLPLGLAGEAPDLSDIEGDWHSEDWVELCLTGLVEDERSIAELEGIFRTRYGRRVRKFDVERNDIAVLSGITSEPIARRFLEIWEARKPFPAESEEAWRKARELGLLRIKETIEARR